MSHFLVIKNLKSPLEDVLITDDIPEKNIDYVLMADVALLEKRVKQVESADEDEDITFIFQPTGRIHLVKNKHEGQITKEFGIEAGHITESDTAGDNTTVSPAGDT